MKPLGKMKDFSSTKKMSSEAQTKSRGKVNDSVTNNKQPEKKTVQLLIEVAYVAMVLHVYVTSYLQEKFS